MYFLETGELPIWKNNKQRVAQATKFFELQTT